MKKSFVARLSTDKNITIADNLGERHISARLSVLTEKHRQMWKVQWFPNIAKMDKTVDPEARWDWRLILKQVLKDPNQQGFCIEYKNQLQGILIVTYKHVRDQNKRPIVFIEYLASAPWNRKNNTLTKDGKARYTLIGTQLIKCAIEFSKSLGYGGRIALDSEKEAEIFYQEKIGMQCKGIKDHYAYYELDNEGAKVFIKKYRFLE